MTPPDFALLNSGLFLLFGMITGAWKHQKMLLSPQHQAPVYVDIAHRAGLMYSFASLVIWKLAEANTFPVAFTWYAVVAPVTFFWTATGTYLYLGVADRTQNQFSRRTFRTTFGMYLLIFFEISGVVLLLAGFLVKH